MERKSKNRDGMNGFTLIELMLVATIIGFLAVIALPKFSSLVLKAKEAALKGKLGALRGALSIYYADTEGMFPPNAYWGLTQFCSAFTGTSMEGKYIDIRDISMLGYVHPGGYHRACIRHAQTNQVIDDAIFHVTAYYYLDGFVTFNCTHMDSQGKPYSTW